MVSDKKRLMSETLGVTKNAKKEEIEKAYNKLKEFFDPSNNSDPNLRIFFDDLTLYALLYDFFQSIFDTD